MKYLTEFRAHGILGKYGLSLPKAYLAKNKSEAVKSAARLGYPIVMKLMSPDILHKSDAGCVRAGIKDANELKEAFDDVLSNAKKYNPKARIEGVLVEEFLSGIELIIGAKKDAQFGPVILFGLGGIFVEAMHDVSIRLVPIARKDAREMIHEIRGHRLLYGYRGKKPVDMGALEDALLKVSKMILEHREIQEMDINPLFANEKGVIVGDARIAVG